METTDTQPFDRSAKASSTVFISVKHETSNLFAKDPSLGGVDIKLNELLLLCENDQCTCFFGGLIP